MTQRLFPAKNIFQWLDIIQIYRIKRLNGMNIKVLALIFGGLMVETGYSSEKDNISRRKAQLG